MLGRFWRVEEGIYADIAHNVEKMRVLVAEVQAKFADKGKIFVVGISGHRVAGEVFASLVGVAKAVIVTADNTVPVSSGLRQRLSISRPPTQ